MARFRGAGEPLSGDGFQRALIDLGVGAAELLALLAVESKSCGFLPDRRPVILFERHWFHKLTRGAFSDEHPDISNPKPGGYAGLAREYPRLEKAVRLDREAALKSASWGAGQVMGFNHGVAGFADVEAMVAAMMASEDAQLMAVVGFLHRAGIVPLMQAHDWAGVARRYNGPAFARNQYDRRLAGAFAQFSSGVLPDIEVRRAQLYLTYLGYAPGSIDGIIGRITRSAIARFRADSGVGRGEAVDQRLLGELQARVQAL